MAGATGRASQRWLVLYDSDCGFCMWLLAALLRWDRRGRLRPVPLQGAEAEDLLADLDRAERIASWHLVSPTGSRSSGGAAIAPLLRLLPAGVIPAAAFARFPGATARGYRWVAENRSGLSRWVPKGSKDRAREAVGEATAASGT
jgi:predicted DCC family thiol-disulfide oxidoreductase YuxK